MIFNENNLYDYDDVNESLIGCKGYFGSSLVAIKRAIENEDSKWFGTVKKINNDSIICRYQNEIGNFYYFYKVD